MTKGPVQLDGSSEERSSTDLLIGRVLGGEEPAWQELAAEIHSRVSRLCRQRGYGRGRERADTQSEVGLRVLERLRAADFEALRSFVRTREKYASSSFLRWLGVVTHNAYVDFVRAQPEVRRTRATGQRNLVRTELVSIDVDSFVSHGSEVQECVEIRRLLLLLEQAEFPVNGRRAILLWLEGHSPGEIADEIGLEDADEAKRVLHAARQRWRRIVSPQSNEGEE